MSPRPKRYRKVERPPVIKGFRPFGSRQCFGLEVSLHFEEFESLKLADYDQCTHAQAAEKMGVSRPTFTRIYEEARRKIALAFVEGRPLHIRGGQAEFSEEWYHCRACQNDFTPVHDALWKAADCPICGSSEPERLTSDHLHDIR
ncbi:MAG: DUF134 domain-containing protein [Bacteroidales bacterium]|nr:DUF134 domain-containing protein [Bacteroidales bacterium]